MSTRRLDRLNSLLKEVISDVIRTEMKNPNISRLFTVTNVDISKDLQHAKVYVSVIGNKEEKTKTLSILQSAAGFIRITASKQVVMRFFPDLTFILDESVETQLHMEGLIAQIQKEREEREKNQIHE